MEMQCFKNDEMYTNEQQEEIDEMFEKGIDDKVIFSYMNKCRKENRTSEYQTYLNKGDFFGIGMDAD